MDVTLHIPTLKEALGYWKAALLLAVLAMTLVWPGDTVLGVGNSIETPDAAGDLRFGSSLALDSSGYPVVSYKLAVPPELKLLHCNDQICVSGGDSITSPDTGTDPGYHSSLLLDSAGSPVISYYGGGAQDLKIVHCNDANCSGGGDSLQTPDTTDQVGKYSSLALDAVGNPVVSYYDQTNTKLKLMHCNDVNCSGGDETIWTVDDSGDVGEYTSLQLDNSGFPVISYYDRTNGDLRIVHCNDPACSGGDDIPTSPAGGGDVGQYTSLQLDASGYPVVSYYDVTGGNLKILHCDDPDCTGGGESDIAPDTNLDIGGYTSLQLDASGYPVVSYYDFTNGNLKVLRCNDADCAPGGESVVSPDTNTNVGQWTSLELDPSDRPVVSYIDVLNYDLKVLHCSDLNCIGTKGPTVVSISNFFQDPLPKTCFDVMNSGQAFLFSVCDNDFQDGFPVSHAACDDGTDTICNDEDPAEGSVTITVDPAVYHVEVGKSPLNITTDATKRVCSGGPTCSLTFTNTSVTTNPVPIPPITGGTRPWNPWDVAGPDFSWPPDGVVDLPNDILGVILHFCPFSGYPNPEYPEHRQDDCTKPPPTPTPTPTP